MSQNHYCVYLTTEIMHENTIYMKTCGAYTYLFWSLDGLLRPHRGDFVNYGFLKLPFIGLKMTDISSPAVAVIASNSWVTYATTKWLTMKPLKIIEYFDSFLFTIRLTVYLIVFMQGIIIRLKYVCASYLYVTYGYMLLD